MRGKVGFVIGAAVGYVLGTRAGRARYEQIKRGAIAVWETPLVQQGVTAVKGSVNDQVQGVKAAASRAAKSAFVAATQPNRDAPSPESRGPRAVDAQGETPA
ncbi:YtxH domain-containing protein [Leucobacter sp. NPDC015123]|uniref:YtxH domain-containing protein n=1 Tax=Leucobacter sp. NPDC015123 TaxID=3364129 RepID=UPI0036F46BEE